MADSFMKLKKIVIPFMTLVIMASQLPGCAARTSQQGLDASGVIDIDGAQIVTDTTDPGIEVINNQGSQKSEEISHDELLVVFEQQYEISKEINNSDSEEAIQNELEMIRITVACMEKSLPSDYEVQYREWRPSAVQQETQTTETTQQPQNQQSQQSQGQQGQSSKPQGSQAQQPPQQQQGDSSGDHGTIDLPPNITITTDPSQIASGTDDPYSGYGEVSIGYGG